MAEAQVAGGVEQEQLQTATSAMQAGATEESPSTLETTHATSSPSLPPTTSAPSTTHDKSASALPVPTISTDIPNSISSPTAAAPQPGQMQRQPTEALGPAADGPITPISPSAGGAASSTGPHLSISLMLTTGARHPYRIDEKYLRSRKVEARKSDGSFDPRELSGYQLKELVWIDWRSEWDPRPASPSSIRLIVMGRMIEDKAALKDFPFTLEGPNVVHMTVKPADLIDDDETGAKGAGKAGGLRGRDSEEQGAGCRCVIL